MMALPKGVLFTLSMTAAATIVIKFTESIFAAIKNFMMPKVIRTVKTTWAKKAMKLVWDFALLGTMGWGLADSLLSKGSPTRFDVLAIVLNVLGIILWLGYLAFQLGRMRAARESAKLADRLPIT